MDMAAKNNRKRAAPACGNTRENMTRAEAKDIPMISQATVVKAGVVRLMELQERGWSYLRPWWLKRMPSPVAFRLWTVGFRDLPAAVCAT